MKAVLIILDGAGLAEADAGNAVTRETMPALFGAMAENGYAVLAASGPAVGLDQGEVGNSEVGHLTIGAGYIIPSTLSRIDGAFRDGSWAANPLWKEVSAAPCLHVVGLLSDAGVHAHWRSLVHAASLASDHGTTDIVVHAVLDGVDSQAGTAPTLLAGLRAAVAEVPRARLGLVIGRRWFCDRSGDLTLTRIFVDAFVTGSDLPRFTGAALEKHLKTASEATFPAHLIPGGSRIEVGEAVLLTQHRADRAKQVARLLAAKHPFYSLVELDPEIYEPRIFFPTRPLPRGLGFELNHGNVQSVRIAETCKFPHVTRFVNGLNRELEGRHICIDSVPEAAIADHPEMSIEGVVHEIEMAVRCPSNRLIIANIANLDQVGHLGRYDLTVEAARHVDGALNRIFAVCREEGWAVLVTADHGNADRVTDAAGRPFGSHTDRPVPFVILPPPGVAFRWRAHDGSLVNIAPSVLTVLGLPEPDYMAASLLELIADPGAQHSVQ